MDAFTVRFQGYQNSSGPELNRIQCVPRGNDSGSVFPSPPFLPRCKADWLVVVAVYGFDFVFRPGANDGVNPEMRHCHASIRLPWSKRVKLHVRISPDATRLASCWGTVASGA